MSATAIAELDALLTGRLQPDETGHEVRVLFDLAHRVREEQPVPRLPESSRRAIRRRLLTEIAAPRTTLRGRTAGRTFPVGRRRRTPARDVVASGVASVVVGVFAVGILVREAAAV